MKNSRKSLLIAASLCLGIFVTSCGENKKNSEEVSTNVNFEDEQNQEILKNYLALKETLVESDNLKAQQTAEELTNSLEAHPELAEMSQRLSSTESIDEQRDVFSELSLQIGELFGGSNMESGELYKQYCPMAFGGKGGYWISDSKEVRNPYFGDRMLKCGEVTETIK